MRIMLLLLMFLGGAAQAELPQYESVQDAAHDWLVLLDSTDYGASYQETGQLVKQQVNPQQWEAGMAAARASMGIFKSRQLVNTQGVVDLPGVPAGQYVILTFLSEFEHHSGNELLTYQLQDNGEWHLVGYFIQ